MNTNRSTNRAIGVTFIRGAVCSFSSPGVPKIWGLLLCIGLMFLPKLSFSQPEAIVDTPATAITPINKLISYPEEAKQAHVHGSVWLKALIDKEGDVQEVRVEKSNNALLSVAATEGMKRARFHPAVKNGEPVSEMIWRSVDFGISHDSSGDKSLNSEEDNSIVVSSEPEALIPIERLLVYPMEAKRSRSQGTVVVGALVSQEGNVEQVRVFKSTNSIFTKSAVDAVKQSKFWPATQNETPIRLWITRTINFKLH